MIRNPLTSKAINGFRRSVITAAIFGTLVFGFTTSSAKTELQDISSFWIELKAATDFGPSKKYQRSRLLSVEWMQNELTKQERWSYIAGTWDALRFIVYHFDNKRFKWLAECQEKNVGPGSFNPVHIESQIAKGQEIGFDPTASATSAIIFNLLTSCVNRKE
jgi:hypothetical protein